MRKSRVLLAGVAVAAAGVATSAFTASNTLAVPATSPATARSPSPAPSSRTSTTPPSPRTPSKLAAVVFTIDHGRHAPRRHPDAQERTAPRSWAPTPAPARAASDDRDLTCDATVGGPRHSVRGLRHRRPDGRPVTPYRGGRGGRPAAPPAPDGAFAMNAAPRAASLSAAVALVLAAVWLFWPRRSAAARPTSPPTASAWSRGSTPVTSRSCGRRPRYSVGDVVAYRSVVAEHRRHAPDRRPGRRPLRRSRATTTTGSTRTTRPATRSSARSGCASRRAARCWRRCVPRPPLVVLRPPRGRRPRDTVRRPRGATAGGRPARPRPRRPSPPDPGLARQVALVSGAVALVAASAAASCSRCRPPRPSRPPCR